MKEMTETERELYKNAAEVTEIIRTLVPCVTMQNVLFDCKNGVTPSTLGANMNLYMRNVITMSFVLAYTRWQQTFANESGELSGESLKKFKASRYSTLFESIGTEENLNLEIMVFSLIEVWVGTHVDDVANKIFDKFFYRDKEGLGVLLQRALKFAYMEELSSVDVCVQNKLLCDVLEGLEIFSYVEMPEDRADFFEFRYRRSGIKYVTLQPNKGCDVKRVCLKGYFDYMAGQTETEQLPKRLRPYIRFGYTRLLDEATYTFSTFDEQYYAEVRLPCVDSDAGCKAEHEKIDAMHQLMAFNYKRLRDFSLVVCDAVNEMVGYKEKIFELYGKKFTTVFPEGRLPKEDYRWDNIVTLLLVELGPSEFLQAFIDPTLFYKIMANVHTRYLSDTAYERMIEEYRGKADAIEKACRYQKHFKELRRKKLMAETIVNAVHNSGDETEKGPDYAMYEESLATKYDKAKMLIDRLKNGAESPLTITQFEETRSVLEDTLKDVLRFLQMFYAGLMAYERRQRANALDGVALQGFIAAAKEKRKAIESLSLSELYESFKKQCTACNPDTSAIGYQLTDDAKSLKNLITRTYICDVKKLEYYADIQNKAVKSTIFDMVEHLSLYTKYPEYNTWLSYILDFFIFLVFNDDCESRGLVDRFECGSISEKEIDPIYPYIVSYYSVNIDRDRVKRCNYKAYVPAKYSSDDKDASITVTLLTEKEYEINTNYYCLPLKYGSTGKWWIEPLMITTKVFADIVKDENE